MPTESTPTNAPPPGQPRQPFTSALLRATFATVLCACVIVMIHGFVSWGLDRDLVPEKDANVLVVIAMAGASVFVIFFAVLVGLTPERQGQTSVVRALSAAIAVYVLTPAVGALAYVIVTGRLFAFVAFFGNHLLSPFVLASALVTLACVLLLPLLSHVRSMPR